MRLLRLERKRTERSRRRFVLMLLDPGRLLVADARAKTKETLLRALSQSIRDTDITGWYEEDAVVGVIFTEIGAEDDRSIVHALCAKVTGALYQSLTVTEINEIRLSFHVFPEDWSDDSPGGPTHSALHLHLASGMNSKTASLRVKRFIDIVGSLAALIVCLPLLIGVAMAIKLTSKGPILFRQVRLGQYGRKFTFLKFRSMYHQNDPTVHKEYMRNFINGAANFDRGSTNGQGLYKLTTDRRITPVGRILRKTSLDELPQFLNVLAGEMSLVGPRPPVPYEFDCYAAWHKQRLLAVKPGITGLWQVDGRSRLAFDDMVRLDLRYAKAWSLWLDFKILLQTPRAVLSGDGAC